MMISKNSVRNRNILKVFGLMSVVSFFSFLSPVQGQVVYDQMDTSESAMIPVQQFQQPQQQQQVEAPTQTEMMRRERMRRELKNEDLLQSRLEELRLQDEKRRTNQILGRESEAQQQANIGIQQTQSMGNMQGYGMNDEVVVSQAAAQVVQQQAVQQVVVEEKEVKKEEVTTVSVQPRIGVTHMSESLEGLDVSSEFSTGLGLTVMTSDNLGIEFGYQYSKYGLNITSSNYFIQNISYYYNQYDSNYETMTLNQNIFEGLVKAYLMGSDSRIRPFIGGGMGYSRSYINYSDDVRQALNSSALSDDYQLSQFLGVLSAGLDLQIGKSVSVGGLVRYYQVISSDEKGAIDNRGFVRPINIRRNFADDDKRYVAGSLKNSSFYSLLLGVNFQF